MKNTIAVRSHSPPHPRLTTCMQLLLCTYYFSWCKSKEGGEQDSHLQIVTFYFYNVYYDNMNVCMLLNY